MSTYQEDDFDRRYAVLRDPNRRLRPGDGLHPPKLDTPPPYDPFSPAPDPLPPPNPPSLRKWDADYTPYEIRTDKGGVRSAAIDGDGFAYTHGAPLLKPPKPHDFLEGMGETDIGNAVKRAASFHRSFTQTNPNDTMFERVYGTEAALRRQATGRGQNPTMAQAAALRGNTGAAEIANAQREAVYGEGGYREQYLRGRAYDNGLSPAERAAAQQELSDLMEIRRINLSDRMNERDAAAYAAAAEAEAGGHERAAGAQAAAAIEAAQIRAEQEAAAKKAELDAAAENNRRDNETKISVARIDASRMFPLGNGAMGRAVYDEGGNFVRFERSDPPERKAAPEQKPGEQPPKLDGIPAETLNALSMSRSLEEGMAELRKDPNADTPEARLVRMFLEEFRRRTGTDGAAGGGAPASGGGVTIY